MKLDVTDEAAVQVVVRTAESLVGPLDYVVNNAGRGFTGAVEETSLADARAAGGKPAGATGRDQGRPARHARRRAGHIVNVTSVSGLAAWHGTGIYGATKFAWSAWAALWRRKWRRWGSGSPMSRPAGCARPFPPIACPAPIR
jgi:NAD(P)-dependent dehydrogenase (short-subunit alcohol dehydrogenase family)